MAGRSGRIGALNAVIDDPNFDEDDHSSARSPSRSPSPPGGGPAASYGSAATAATSSATTADTAPADGGTRSARRRGSSRISSSSSIRAAQRSSSASGGGGKPAAAGGTAAAVTSAVSPEQATSTVSAPTAATAMSSSSAHEHAASYYTGTGCLTCKADDDHANLMLCERCNDEYHTYCLDPPLVSVPEGDWFCDKCKPFHAPNPDGTDDGLSALISALPPPFTSRFGEIVWAAGGVGFGWWPACIYDPRLTIGTARHLARKHLGKKHLVYFFECHDAPFTVLGNAKICSWEEGLLEEYDLGRTARNAGKNKTTMFERALQSALLEVSKPMDMRMEWNHGPNQNQQQAQHILTRAGSGALGGGGSAGLGVVVGVGGGGVGKRRTSFSSGGGGEDRGGEGSKKSRKKKRQQQQQQGGGSGGVGGGYDGSTNAPRRSGRGGTPKKPPAPFSAGPAVVGSGLAAVDGTAHGGSSRRTVAVHRTNIGAAMEALSARVGGRVGGGGSGSASIEIEPADDGQLFCKILLLRKKTRPAEAGSLPGSEEGFAVDSSANVGFVALPSRRSSTFADARAAMESDLDEDALPPGMRWKFYVPKLGPVSTRQEQTVGPMLEFLKRTTSDERLGDGMSWNPLKVVVTDCGSGGGGDA